MSKASINKVLLIGNLGADADVRNTANGGVVTTLSVATSESWIDKTTGERQDRTEWSRVKCFGKLGEIMADLGKKGRQVYVEGSLRTDKYEKDGIERYSTDVIADEVKLLGAKPADANASEEAEGAEQAEGAPAAPAPAPASNGGDNGNRGYGARN